MSELGNSEQTEVTVTQGIKGLPTGKGLEKVGAYASVSFLRHNFFLYYL